MRAPGKLIAGLLVLLASMKDKEMYNNLIKTFIKDDIDPAFLESFREDIRSVLVGNLLGDGSIAHPLKGNIYYRFKQGLIHYEYFSMIFGIFKPWLTAGSPYFDLLPAFLLKGDWRASTILLTISTRFNDLLGIDYLASIFYYRNDEGK